MGGISGNNKTWRNDALRGRIYDLRFKNLSLGCIAAGFGFDGLGLGFECGV